MENLERIRQIKIHSNMFYNLNKDRFENPGLLLKAKLDYLVEKGLLPEPSRKKVA